MNGKILEHVLHLPNLHLKDESRCVSHNTKMILKTRTYRHHLLRYHLLSQHLQSQPQKEHGARRRCSIAYYYYYYYGKAKSEYIQNDKFPNLICGLLLFWVEGCGVGGSRQRSGRGGRITVESINMNTALYWGSYSCLQSTVSVHADEYTSPLSK